MDIHKNARLTPRGRERMVSLVRGGQTPQAVSAAVGVCPRTVRKWIDRYNSEGLAGLRIAARGPGGSIDHPHSLSSNVLKRYAAFERSTRKERLDLCMRSLPSTRSEATTSPTRCHARWAHRSSLRA